MYILSCLYTKLEINYTPECFDFFSQIMHEEQYETKGPLVSLLMKFNEVSASGKCFQSSTIDVFDKQFLGSLRRIYPVVSVLFLSSIGSIVPVKNVQNVCFIQAKQDIVSKKDMLLLSFFISCSMLLALNKIPFTFIEKYQTQISQKRCT